MRKSILITLSIFCVSAFSATWLPRSWDQGGTDGYTVQSIVPGGGYIWFSVKSASGTITSVYCVSGPAGTSDMNGDGKAILALLLSAQANGKQVFLQVVRNNATSLYAGEQVAVVAIQP